MWHTTKDARVAEDSVRFTCVYAASFEQAITSLVFFAASVSKVRLVTPCSTACWRAASLLPKMMRLDSGQLACQKPTE